MSAVLRAQVARLGLAERVRFLGPTPPDDLRWPLSAADLFVLSTRNEGWANVILEAMACGLPVIATDVGGNAEVIADADLGLIVPFGDHAALVAALDQALTRKWDGARLRQYALDNSWDNRVRRLAALFRTLVKERS